MGPIEFWVSGSAGHVGGEVALDPGTPFLGAEVVLVPDDLSRQDLFRSVNTDQYGRFTLPGVAPGRYRLFAWEGAPEGAYRDPAFINRHRDSGLLVEVRGGDRIEASPRLTRAGF